MSDQTLSAAAGLSEQDIVDLTKRPSDAYPASKPGNDHSQC